VYFPYSYELMVCHVSVSMYRHIKKHKIQLNYRYETRRSPSFETPLHVSIFWQLSKKHDNRATSEVGEAVASRRSSKLSRIIINLVCVHTVPTEFVFYLRNYFGNRRVKMSCLGKSQGYIYINFRKYYLHMCNYEHGDSICRHVRQICATY
jgi:hypothetical protein